MLSLEETLDDINKIKSDLKEKKEVCNKLLHEIKNSFQIKFKEVEEIFKQIDQKGLKEIIDKSEILLYKENDVVFKKGEDCIKYYFLIFGDVTIYSEDKNDIKSKLLKTISGGTVFGHKVKDKLQYYAYSKSSQVLIMTINKESFNNIIEEFKTRSDTNKSNFIKKYIPYIRNSGEDNLEKVKDKFMKMIYQKGAKINIDGEYDDYIYLIYKGECNALKSIKKINNLNEYITSLEIKDKTHVILDTYSKR